MATGAPPSDPYRSPRKWLGMLLLVAGGVMGVASLHPSMHGDPAMMVPLLLTGAALLAVDLPDLWGRR